jgi:hypothetical protein
MGWRNFSKTAEKKFLQPTRRGGIPTLNSTVRLLDEQFLPPVDSTIRPMLAAYQNFSRFSSLLLKIGLILCFGKSRAFQPAKPNVLFPFFTLYSYLFLQHIERRRREDDGAPPPKSVRRLISEYVDRKKRYNFFKLTNC